MICKLRLERADPNRIRVRVFCGADEEHLEQTGTLLLHVGEYQTLSCALLMGSKQMIQTDVKGEVIDVPLQVTIDGEERALNPSGYEEEHSYVRNAHTSVGGEEQ